MTGDKSKKNYDTGKGNHSHSKNYYKNEDIRIYLKVCIRYKKIIISGRFWITKFV